MENIQKIIGENLSEIRKNRNLTLNQLSDLTGVSKGMLAQIEKSKTNPTVSTLWKIANGLQVSFSSFTKERRPVVNKLNIKDMASLTDDNGKYIVYNLFPDFYDRAFEVYYVELHSACSYEGRSHMGEEFILVKEGTVTVNIHEETYNLDATDALHFMGSTKHDYYNETNERVSFYMIVHYSGTD